jgi:hypothetical protein
MASCFSAGIHNIQYLLAELVPKGFRVQPEQAAIEMAR